MKFFITTAIDYVNSLPHIGTAYEKVGADILARFHRMDGDTVLFQMGNDEHSVNVKKAAVDAKTTPKAYADGMKPKFEEVWKKLSISYNQFIQTSDPRHHAAVKKFFTLLHEKGDIFEGDYEGLYCESCEAFYTEKDLTPEGFCPQHQSKPKWIKEKNYFFKLSKYEKPLLEYIEKNTNFILPVIRRNEIKNVIKGGLRDISISRSGFDWGIPLPINPKHVVYVWFDALINYLTLIGFADIRNGNIEKIPLNPPFPKGENSNSPLSSPPLEKGVGGFSNDLFISFKQWWPADLHVIGKDITRFHCVIWPAMLMSAGLPLPHTVFGHGFVYLKGEKMSKSLGNVVTPLDVADKYGADALRYYLVRSASFGDDSNFTWDDFITRYNADLANGLGNLVSRTAGMISRYFNGTLNPSPLSGKDAELASRFQNICGQIRDFLDPQKSGDIFFHRALETLWGWIGEIDRTIDTEAPWVLAKQKNEKRLAEVLTAISQAIFSITILLAPFLPTTAEKIWTMYGWNTEIPFEKINFKTEWPGKPIVIQKSSGLFPRIET